MKKLFVGLCIILVIGLVGESIVLALNIGQVSQLEKQVATLQQNNQALDKDKTDLTGDKTNLMAENSKLKQDATTQLGQISSLQESSQKLTDQIKSLTDNVTTLNGVIAQNKSDLSKANLELDATTKKFMCKNTLASVDFKNNQTVNDALATFVEGDKSIEEPISSKFWNVIWTNYNYSIHTISVHSEKDNMNYLWKFTVYFNGEAYGKHVNAIFYNDQQCWLYLDK